MYEEPVGQGVLRAVKLIDNRCKVIVLTDKSKFETGIWIIVTVSPQARSRIILALFGDWLV
jgi:hypothetical protein